MTASDVSARADFAASFLNGSTASTTAYRSAVNAVATLVTATSSWPEGAVSGASPAMLAALFAELDPCPEQGTPLDEVLTALGPSFLLHSVHLADPLSLAHLHCPPLIPSLAAEALLTASNASMDSFDQAPAATLIEMSVVQWLCRLYGLGEEADGVFTSGGTQSNLMGLLLARDTCGFTGSGPVENPVENVDVPRRTVQQDGLPAEAKHWRVFCSETSHFSVRQSAAVLGLGHACVVAVPASESGQILLPALDHALASCESEGNVPLAIVATAGTTDYGSIDPLAELAARARRVGAWLHVDAAVGGALALSSQHHALLTGIELADSLTVDFHKLFWQPVSCSAFLVRDRENLHCLRLHTDYLDRTDEESMGIPNLVGKSLATTRRFDALKLLVSLRTLGREGFAAMLDYTIALAAEVAGIVQDTPSLHLACRPQINTVLLRWQPSDVLDEQADEVNIQVQQSLYVRGEALVGRTRHRGAVYLKFSLLNPCATLSDIAGLLTTLTTRATILHAELLALSPRQGSPSVTGSDGCPDTSP